MLQPLNLGYSLNTIHTYHYFLLRYINAYKRVSIETIGEFGQEKINDYHRIMKEDKNYSTTTINQSVNAIKLYYLKVLKRDMVFEEVERPKREKTLPKVWSADEVQRIMSCVDNIKHKALLSLIYGGGMRIGEALSLKVHDINSKTMRVRINQAKGKKDRYTLLGHNSLKLLREYVKEFNPGEYLFEGQFGGKYSSSSIGKVLDKAIKKSGVAKRGGLHVLRHSFATHMLESGTDIRYIQDLLGHYSSTTTEIYTHVSNKYLDNLKSPMDDLDI